MSRRASYWLIFVSAILLPASVALILLPHERRARRLDSIRTALDARDLATAYDRLTDHLQREPDDRDAILDAARTARRLGEFDAADRHLKRYESLGGSKQEIELERLLRQSQSGSLAGAAGAFRFCADQPDHTSVPLMLEALTRGYLAAGQPMRAIESADLWLRRDPSAPERAYATHLRGRALEMQGNIPAAIDEYKLALELDPRSDDGRLALAEILSREEPAQARPLFEELQARPRRSIDARLGYARCLRQLGELARAAEIVAELKRERTDAVPLLVESARIALDRGRAADAEPDLVRALELAPRDRDAHVQIVRCLRDRGRDAEAAKWLERLTALDAELFRKLSPTGAKP
jgi:tetratricopeptide (TPR) repeat protein